MGQSIKVAVYGTLKHGRYNNVLLSRSEILSVERLKGWEMYDLGAYPAVKPSDSTECTIHVEIYEVDKEVLKNIDRLEGFPRFYNRKLVETSVGEAYIYFLDRRLPQHMKIKEGKW